MYVLHIARFALFFSLFFHLFQYLSRRRRIISIFRYREIGEGRIWPKTVIVSIFWGFDELKSKYLKMALKTLGLTSWSRDWLAESSKTANYFKNAQEYDFVFS